MSAVVWIIGIWLGGLTVWTARQAQQNRRTQVNADEAVAVITQVNGQITTFQQGVTTKIDQLEQTIANSTGVPAAVVTALEDLKATAAALAVPA